MLYRNGCDMVQALHMAMGKFRLYSLKSETTMISFLEGRLESLTSSSAKPNILLQLRNVCEMLNSALVKQIDRVEGIFKFLC